MKILWRHLLYPFTATALLVIVPLHIPLAFADVAATSHCSDEYTPSPAGFDFTSTVNRWGQDGSTEALTRVEGKEIGAIHINRLPIFDVANPRENRRIYRWANRAHQTTRPAVVRKLLLFAEGDPLNRDLLAESERILRDQKYLGDAVIRVAGECGDRVDLEVVSKEVWTLVPEISLHLAGGSSKTRIGLRDSNFLGTGKRFSLIQVHDSDRDSVALHYTDVNFGGKRYVLRTNYEESSDGYDRLLRFGLPFYALGSERAWTIMLHQNKRVDHQYAGGREISAVSATDEFADLYYGWSRGVQEGTARRFTVGMRYHHLTFRDSGDPQPATWPDDLQFVYPYLEYEQIEDRYTKAFNLDQMYQIEDLHVGLSLRASLGYAPGADRTLLFDGEVRDTFVAKERQLLIGAATWEGRWRRDQGGVEDGMVNLSLRYHRGQTASRSLFIGLQGDLIVNPTPVNQVVLGGETGLRGYPKHIQSGDRKYLMTIEERSFTDYHFMNLVRVGYAFFADTGTAWSPSGDRRDNLTSIGFGLRLAPSKSTKGEVIHLDISFPVSRRGEVDGYQITAELKETL